MLYTFYVYFIWPWQQADERILDRLNLHHRGCVNTEPHESVSTRLCLGLEDYGVGFRV